MTIFFSREQRLIEEFNIKTFWCFFLSVLDKLWIPKNVRIFFSSVSREITLSKGDTWILIEKWLSWHELTLIIKQWNKCLRCEKEKKMTLPNTRTNSTKFWMIYLSAFTKKDYFIHCKKLGKDLSNPHPLRPPTHLHLSIFQ